MPQTQTTVPSKCLNCQAELTSPIVCTGCQALFPTPKTADYFNLLGLPRRYAVDEAQVTSSFRAMARNVHPDRFAGQPEETRSLATRLSAEINKAVSVLLDPVQRGSYMLELAGGPGAAEVREVPGDLLAEVMTLREQIIDAHDAKDTHALEQMRTSIETSRAALLRIIADGADGLPECGDREKKDFRRTLNAIKYYDNLLTELAGDPLTGNPETDHD